MVFNIDNFEKVTGIFDFINMTPPLRKCSKEDCPPRNISADRLRFCFRCKDPIHLPCYGVDKTVEEIFFIDNIVMVCDKCLGEPYEMPSPKRKQSTASVNLVQSTIDVQNPVLSLSKTVTVTPAWTPSKSNTAKNSQQMQTVIETLVQKIETQTSTIEGLKASVDTMNETVSLQKVAVGESIKVNHENISSIKKTLDQVPNVNSKKSYAEAAKQGIVTYKGTPTTSRSKQTPKSNKPIMPGASKNVIGKPLDNRFKTKPEKAIWLSRVHRETTADEIADYVKNSIGITSPDIEVRKLVKKERDLSTYSFVSFCIKCSTSNFAKLMDPMNWPETSRIREFDLELRTSAVPKFPWNQGPVNREPVNQESANQEPESKNEEPETPALMDLGPQSPVTPVVETHVQA